MTRMVLTIAAAGLGLWGAGTAWGEGMQALVGHAGRVQISRGKEKLGEFGAGLYNSQWAAAFGDHGAVLCYEIARP